mgnify:CR=1 FL=1
MTSLSEILDTTSNNGKCYPLKAFNQAVPQHMVLSVPKRGTAYSRPLSAVFEN